MRAFLPALLGLALSGSTVLAATNDAASLAPGRPAGVQQASRLGPNFLLIAGVAVVAAGIAIVVSNSNSNNNPTTTTTGTAP